MTIDGLISVRSANSPAQTADRLDQAVRAKGMTMFARVDHAAGAREVGLSLRPTEVLIFGNARAGTPLMQAEQTIGLDLPLKALVWEDASGAAWITCSDPHWLARHYALGGETDRIVAAMAAALDAVTRQAAEPV